MPKLFSTPISTTGASAWLLVTRIAVGAAMLTHGWTKLKMLIDGGGAQFPDPIGIGAMPSLMLAVFAEALCSAMLILGVATRWAAIPLAFTMAVAFFVVHGGDPFAKKELACIYFLVYGCLIVFGGGRFSVDHWLGKGKA